MTARLGKSSNLPANVDTPKYNPDEHDAGIVHFGLGAFHRAHQAVYTDTALAEAGGDWRITGVSLRSKAASDELVPQDMLYSLIVKGEAKVQARIIGSLAQAISFVDEPERVLDAMLSPKTKILSLTVTEKAYGIDRIGGGVDQSDPAIAADLGSPDAPSSVIGLLSFALKRRREMGLPPFTVLCCDNLPDNGALLRGGVVDFASRVDAEFGQWVAHNVAFPSTMVDRITPAKTNASLDFAKQLIGCEDQASIETEPFSQWVVEDNFPTGRPAWEAGGALFVKDVAPYENMKLRMLNGAHSMLAYSGYLAGHEFVCDVMSNPALRSLVSRHLHAASLTLAPLHGINFDEYAASLVERFENPEIKHQTFQIAMDGTEKLPQRIFLPAVAALKSGQPIQPFAFATAAWMRFCQARTDDGHSYHLNDPLAVKIASALNRAERADQIAESLFNLETVFPKPLLAAEGWRENVVKSLETMIEQGMKRAILLEATSCK